MAKRKKPGRQGQSGDPRKRAAEERAIEERAAAERAQAEATPELEDEVEAALAADHPIDIAMLASSLIASLDPSAQTPDPDSELVAELPEPAEFVRMFLESHDPRLHTLAWTAAQLLPDDALQAEVAAAIAPDTVPAWLQPLADPEVTAAWQTIDPLQDSTDIIVSLRIGDADLSIVGLIDFNVEGALKDAFAVPAPLPALQQALSAGGAGMQTRDVTPADARAWLAGALEAGRAIDPPFTSESWPQARPLLEWVLRQLPDGGRSWEPTVWSRAEIGRIVDDFAAAPEGGVVADAADREVLVDALERLSAETSTDPQLLSAVKLEVGLGYLWATTVHHDLDAVLSLPDALVSYVRWAHAARDIPTDDTDEALAAIAHHRARFVLDVTEILGEADD